MDDSPWMPPSDDAAHPASGESAAEQFAADAPAGSPSVESPWARGATGAQFDTDQPPTPASAESAVPASSWSRPDPASGVALAPPPVSTDAVPIAPQAPRRNRSRIAVGVAAASVVAVGGAGVFAFSRMAAGPEGGAGTPEELGTALMTALENEDVLGMFDLLLPSEADLLRQPAIDLVAELSRLEVLTPDATLSQLAGIDIQLEGQTVTATSTNVADIVNLDLQAEVTTSVDGTAVPVGSLITDNLSEDDLAELRASTTTTEPLDTQLTAVEHDGRWYVSLAYTAAEAIRADAAPESAIPVEGIGANGAESPEAAFDAALDRLQALDLTPMMQILNPGEAAALQRYAPLFVDDAQAELNQALADFNFQWEITDRRFHVVGEGEQRTVLLDALAIEGSGGDEYQQVSFSFGFEGECMTYHIEATDMPDMFDFEQCAGEEMMLPGVGEGLEEMPAVMAFLDELGTALSDIEPIGIEVREYEGAWYVSPTATYSQALLKVLRAFDRQELDRLIELGEPAAEEFFDSWFGFGDYEPEIVYEEEAAAESSDGGWSLDPSATEEFQATGYELCYEELDADAALACFQPYLDSGEIDPTWLPVVLRFPECGLTSSWGGELSSMSDADFIATIEAARPCFLALVEAGTINEYELPSEVFNFECFEGRNWYNTFDDPAYDERYSACVDALYAE